MSSTILTVNEPKAYHNCEMIFRFSNKDIKSDFRVDETQQYKIHTTLKEVALLNEALSIFQRDGFKDGFLKYTSVQDGSNKYPEFVIHYIDAVQTGKQLQAVANDEDSLVQLSEYCLETPPTYEDDFRINKTIESIHFEDEEKRFIDYEDMEDYMEALQENRPELFA